MPDDRKVDPEEGAVYCERDGAEAGRYLRVVRDEHGRLWICPEGVDENRDLASQGCWRSDDSTSSA